MPLLRFTVDSALLRELGERLVGKPFIALAELVKNSYDADATTVLIELDPHEDRIVVLDNGQGMDLEEFSEFWMRVGSTHKVRQKFSKKLRRPITGSKGVGRLSVQYLASELTITTTSEKDVTSRLRSHINWEEAVRTGNLTDVTVDYEIEKSARKFEPGTKITLTKLKQQWSLKDVGGLANELWWLRPAFKEVQIATDPKSVLQIQFSSRNKRFETAFSQRMNAVLDLWAARIIGKNEKGHVSLMLVYAGKEPRSYTHFIKDCRLNDGSWEVRIYHWKYRQPFGIKIMDVRKYFNQYGGVHVYDGGFHLPYYGDPRNDWLRVEIDHSHRLTLSPYLPKNMQIPLGLQFLPTLSRVFGIVHVNTSQEPNLQIQITRDRFQEGKALEDLREMVRVGLDWYAREEKLRVSAEKIKKAETIKFQRIEDVLVKYEPSIPKGTYAELCEELRKATEILETEAEKSAREVGLMGSLATAGITSLASQHELNREFQTIEEIVERIRRIRVEDERLRKTLEDLQDELSSWVERARATNALFAYFGEAENVKLRRRFPAKKVLNETSEQLRVLSRGTPIDLSSVEEDFVLPEASLVEWSAIFQNVLMNAFNAVLDSERKLIKVITRADGRTREILVEDTGLGLDLENSEILFQPFERRIVISPERRALGYGGMGLGLTIVRLVANNIGCQVSFVKPDAGFKTAFSIKWRETE